MTTTDQLTSKLLEIINQIQAGIVAHTPDAMGLALASVQQDGIANIFPGIISLILLIICVYIGIKFYKKWETKNAEEKKKEWRDREDASLLITPTVVASGVGAIAFFIMCVTLFSYWNYVEIFNPKVYLAHQIIEKVMQQ